MPGAMTAVLGPVPGNNLLTANQQTFAAKLSSLTGLAYPVVGAWLLAEESGSAAQSRQAANNNDWLNIGYTGSGTYGATDSIWKDPSTAATATASWLSGKAAVPGYGTASTGIQSILASAGSSPQAQISAIQKSGWAASGYKDLPSLYSRISGTNSPVSDAVSGAINTVGNAVGDVTGIPGAISSAFNTAVGDAKYAAVLVVALLVGAYMIMHAFTGQGARPILERVSAGAGEA